MNEYEIKWLMGTIQIKPITYWLEEEIIKHRFWFSKKQYFVVCDFCRLGPMNLKMAKYHLNIANHV